MKHTISKNQLQWRSRLAHGTYKTVFMYDVIVIAVKICRGREFEPRLEKRFVIKQMDYE